MPAIAKLFPLPVEIDPTIARFGFHGLSYEYIVSVIGARGRGRTIIAHLGSGASLCALLDGSPIDTTMGFSTLGGLMMATRPGDLDPGVLLQLIQSGYGELEKLTDLLHRDCGDG
jgi:acetate kinase